MHGKRQSRGARGALGLAAAMLVAWLACACSTQRNTPLSRQWQAFTTRYNVYYNGSEHLHKELRHMEDTYADDYSRELPVHPAAAYAREGAPRPQGDFKRTMEKMQKAIQLHSILKRPQRGSRGAADREFRQREEFNPFLYKAWLTLVEAQYYAGDFSGAAATAAYVARHYRHDPSVGAEAQLWRARAYAALGWQHDAENALRAARIVDPDTTKRAHQYDLVATELALLRRDLAGAVEPLRRSIKRSSGSQKRRLNFLLGQVLQQLNRREEASQAYRAAESGLGAPYEAKLAARLRRSEVYTGGDARREAESLRHLTRYARNAEYLDRIYAAIGNLYMARGDTARATAAYREAVDTETSDARAHALAALALANILFAQRNYVGAQPLYADALPNISASRPDYSELKQRSDALDTYVGYADALQMQDSLLALSRLPEKEQLEVCRRLAREAERARREAEGSGTTQLTTGPEAGTGNGPAGQGNGGGASAPQQFTMQGDSRWYFYNPTAVRNGMAEFRRRWGNRPLEDNWRRADKAAFLAATQTDSVADEGEERKEMTEEEEAATDITRPEYYMAQIPRTPEAQAAAEAAAAEAMLGEARTLYARLDDAAGARRVYEQYLERFPESSERAEVLFDLCMMAAAAGDEALADRRAAELLAIESGTPRAEMLGNPGFTGRLKRMAKETETLYNKAFQAYCQGEAAVVDSLAGVVRRDFPMSDLMPNFVFINALSRLSERDSVGFRQGIEEVVERWPEARLAPLAAAMAAGVRDNQPIIGSGAMPDLSEARRRANMGLSDTTEFSPDSIPAFTLVDDAPHYLVVFFPLAEVNANEVLYEVARFNFSTFNVSTFDLEPLSDGDVGLLLVKGFANRRQVDRYRTLLEGPDGATLPEGVRMLGMSEADFEHLLSSRRSFDDYQRFAEELAARRAAALEEKQHE